MSKSYLAGICLITFILMSILVLGCAHERKVLYSVPLCNCNNTVDKVRGGRYTCGENTECVRNKGLNSTWTPVN